MTRTAYILAIPPKGDSAKVIARDSREAIMRRFQISRSRLNFALRTGKFIVKCRRTFREVVV